MSTFTPPFKSSESVFKETSYAHHLYLFNIYIYIYTGNYNEILLQFKITTILMFIHLFL